MAFLANENFPYPGILLLRQQGYSVKSIAEVKRGASDEDVLRIAVNEKLIILTFDSDYGELIFRYASQNPPAVIYFREQKNSPFTAAKTLINLLESESILFENAFTVIDNESIRQRHY